MVLVGFIRMAQAVKPFIPLVKSVVRRPMNGNSGEAMDWRDNKADICSVDAALLRSSPASNLAERTIMGERYFVDLSLPRVEKTA